MNVITMTDPTAAAAEPALSGTDDGLVEEILRRGTGPTSRAVPDRGVIGAGWSGTTWPGRRRWEWVLLAITALLTIAVPALTAFDIAVPGRAMLAVAFVALVPGLPIAIALLLPDGRVTAVLAVALSLASTLLSGALATTADAWNPERMAAVIGLIGLVAVAGAAVRLRNARAAVPTAGHAPVDEHAAGWNRGRVASLLVVAGAGCLWWASTQGLDAGRAGVLGLLPVLPWTYWVAIVLIVAVLAVGLLRPVMDHLMVAVAMLALVVALYGTVNVSDGAGSVGAGWVHVGFIDIISRTGEMATGLDARFSWPGFLAGSAQLVSWAGLADAAPLLILAPVAFNVLLLPALWLTGRVITGSDRLAWFGVALYLLFNWYQQDYYSSQATGFVLAVSVTAVLLWAFSSAHVPNVPGRSWTRWSMTVRRVPGRPQGVSAATMVGVEALLIGVIAALIVSHQLTPLTLLGTLVWFVLAGATRWRTLWLVASGLFIGWFSYGAVDFWAGHLATVLGDLGQVGQTVSKGVGERLVGDPLYQSMQLTRIAWTGLLGLAAVGGWWFLRRRTGAILVAGLAALPLGLVLVQSYGGEVIIRCALYASPILAPLAAVGIARLGRALTAAAPTMRTPLLAVLLLLAAVGFTTTRGLNVSFERVTAGQESAARALLDHAAAGSTIGTLGAVGPLPMGRLTDLRRMDLYPGYCELSPPECVSQAAFANGSPGPDYVYVTSGQAALGELQGAREPGWTRQVIDTLLATGGYQLVLDQPDVTVLQRVTPVAGSVTADRTDTGRGDGETGTGG